MPRAKNHQIEILRISEYQISLIFGMFLSFILTGNMLLAGFCIIDDHNQATWLGSDHSLQVGRLWSSLMATEVGTLGSGGRFRPIYIIYMEIEAWLFGDRPILYHAFRILDFGLFLGVLGHIASRCIGLFHSLLLVTAVSGLRFWVDIWTISFGPAEQIALFGMSLILIALAEIVPSLVNGRSVPFWALPTASYGMAVAAGAKENFIFLSVLLTIVILILISTKKVPPLSFFLSLPPFLIIFIVCYAAYRASEIPQDFYGSNNSISHRMNELKDHYIFTVLWICTTLGAFIQGFIVWRYSDKQVSVLQNALIGFVALIVYLAAYGLWEMLFYNGRLPSGIRYDFPFILIFPAIVLGFSLFTQFCYPELNQRRSLVLKTCSLTLIILFLVPFGLTFSLPRASFMAVAKTTAFRDDFTRAQIQTISHPTWPIVLEPTSPWDYEVVVTFKDWALFYKIESPLLLNVQIFPNSVHDQFQQSLTQAMLTFEKTGSHGFGALSNSETLNGLGGRCFVISFHGPSTSPCSPLPIAIEKYTP